jgi:hypothetical protein
VFTVLILVLVWFFFVETRGLSLEEIATGMYSRYLSVLIKLHRFNADLCIVFDGRERYEAALESVQASGKKKDDEAVEMHHVERGA